MSITVEIEKSWGDFTLQVKLAAENEVLALLGASGSGKSLTLKCIAGLERPERGRIELDGRTLFDSERGINLSPQERRTGLLFQSYALFPNMTVAENIAAGARREPDKERRRRLIDAIVEGFGLSPLLAHYPRQLSGGQQQRTALARLLVSAPDILLLDEPFSALDSHLRFQLEGEVRRLMRDFGRTVILVSHDRGEVFRLADKIAVLHAGRVADYGAKERVFAAPATLQAARLTGCANISPLKPLDDGRVLATDWGIALQAARPLGGAAYLGIRAQDLRAGAGENSFACTVRERIDNPFSVTMLVQAAEGGSLIAWETDRETAAKITAGSVVLSLPQEKILLLGE